MFLEQFKNKAFFSNHKYYVTLLIMAIFHTYQNFDNKSVFMFCKKWIKVTYSG